MSISFNRTAMLVNAERITKAHCFFNKQTNKFVVFDDISSIMVCVRSLVQRSGTSMDVILRKGSIIPLTDIMSKHYQFTDLTIRLVSGLLGLT